MELWIYEKDLTPTAVYDGVRTATATEEFRGPGRFSLTAKDTDAALFVPERIVTFPGIGGGYVVESVCTDYGTGEITVTGRGVLSLFARRILPEYVTGDFMAEELIGDLTSRYGPAVLSAPLSRLDDGSATAVNVALGGGTLLSALKTAAGAAGLGLSLAVAGGVFAFSLPALRDSGRTLTRDKGDFIGGRRLWDVTSYANRVTVRGENGRSVTLDAAGLFPDGFDDGAAPLREIAVYAGHIAPARYKTDAEYEAALRAEARRILSERRPKRSGEAALSSRTAKGLRLGESALLADSLTGWNGRAFCEKRQMTLSPQGEKWSATLTFAGA